MNTLTGSPTRGNGGPLPSDRAKAVELGMTQYHTVAAERDEARGEVALLRSELAAANAQIKMLESSVANAESLAAAHQAERDQAVADRAQWEAFYTLLRAQFDAFEVPVSMKGEA